MTNYTIQDIFGSVIAFVIFPVIFVAPGYVVSWAADLFDFRKRQTATRFVIAIVISVAVSPIILFLTYDLASVKLTLAVLAGFAISFIIILAKNKNLPVSREIRHLQFLAMLAAAGWTLFAIASLVDIQLGDRLYFNIVSHDFTTRVAIINAITRTGVPPVNPSYFPDRPVRLTYLYYFWYILCNLVEQIGGTWVNARVAMFASVAWCGLALMGAVALYLRIRNPEGGKKAWKSGLLGSGLLLVSGLDIIPILFWLVNPKTAVNFAYLEGDLEQWNEQITAWLGALLWVPHHVAALVACIAGVTLLHSIRGKTASQQIKVAIIIGLAFASAVGLSTFVTLVFAVFWALWLIVSFLRREFSQSLIMMLAGVIALLAASPFLMGLIGNGNSSSGSELPIALAVRVFRPVVPLIFNYPPFLQDLVFLLLLPINYLVELGFFFIAGLFWIQEHDLEGLKQNPYHLSEVLLLLATLFIGSFVRSTVIGSNDFGWRAWLPGQFILLVWGVDVINRLVPDSWDSLQSKPIRTQKMVRQLEIFIAIGILTTIVDVMLLRIWPMMVDSGAAIFPNSLSPDTQLGKRTLAARQAYEYVNENTPENAIIEINPANLLDIPVGLYADRQIAISGQTAFGVSLHELETRASMVTKIFSETSWETIDQSCKENTINFLVANDLDPLWKNLAILVQQRKPLYQNQYYAIFPCGNLVKP